MKNDSSATEPRVVGDQNLEKSKTRKSDRPAFILPNLTRAQKIRIFRNQLNFYESIEADELYREEN